MSRREVAEQGARESGVSKNLVAMGYYRLLQVTRGLPGWGKVTLGLHV